MELTDEFSEFIRDMEAMLLCQKQRMLRALAPAFASASASASLGQAPVARSNERRWAHQQLTADGREAFIALYREMESRDGVFRFFASSSAALRSWPAVVLAEQFLLSALFLWARPSSASASLLLSALACVLGVLALQLTFVASHTAAHALMLEYSEHRPAAGSKRMTRMGQIIPVYFFAFYHHHASRDDVCTQAIYTVACDSFMGRFFLPYRSWSQDWAPFLSYNDASKSTRARIWDHAGTRGVIASHWVGYSHIPYLLPPVSSSNPVSAAYSATVRTQVIFACL